MKNKFLILILVGILILDIVLIISNQRLKGEYKTIILSVDSNSIHEDSFNDNDNLKHIHETCKAIDDISTNEMKSVEIIGNYIVVNIEAETIERVKSIEKFISKEIKLGVPEMELYFSEKGITGFLKYRGENLWLKID